MKSQKKKNVADVVAKIKQLANKSRRIVFLSGNFNVLHPGHMRLFKFASECGDFLVVGVAKDGIEGAFIDENLRLQGVQSISAVNFAFLMTSTVEELITELQPHIVVKGREHEEHFNPEQSIVEGYGGKLLFSSGEARFSSMELLQMEMQRQPSILSVVNKPTEYIKRHHLDNKALLESIKAFAGLRVLVIGDLIIDEYITCDPLGMSQEDPTIVVTPIKKDLFIGGAGIVAAHAAGLGAQVSYFGIAGKDETAKLANQKLANYGVDVNLIIDESRPTTLKQRFRARGKTLLRVSHLKQHDISHEHISELLDQILPQLNELDLLIFSDFNYGCLLKEQILGLIPNHKWVMLAPTHRVANKHLLSYWEPYFLVFRNPLICFFIQSTARWGLCFHSTTHYMRAIGSTQAAYRIFRDWGDRPPIIQLSEQDIMWGNQQLSAMGLPHGAWFVCLHVREGGFSPVDESLHQHRNADLDRAYLAVSEIVRRGGWVIRLGDPSMTRMRTMPHTVDYAHHPLRSARLDIFLCAQCNFILGNTSGIALVGTVFGVPSALANMVPITAMGFGSRDISIPKLYKSIVNNSYIGVPHIIQLGLGSAQYYSQYVEAGVEVEENSAEDILDLTKEMFESLTENSQNYLHRSTIQSRFTGIFCDGDYAFGTPSKAGVRFLLKHLTSLRI